MLLPAVTLAAACGGEAPAGSGGADGKPVASVVTARGDLRDSPVAAIRGLLEVDRARGCLLLSGRPVLWPVGTTLVDRSPALRLRDGRVVEPGDEVRGDGGNVRVSHAEALANDNVETLRRCAGQDEEVILLTTIRAITAKTP